MTTRLATPACLILLLALPGHAAGPFDHAVWDGLLQRYVDDAGRVAYRDLEARDLPSLDAYLGALGSATPDAWPRGDRLAFWLNAYNAVIVRAVLDGYSAEGVLARHQIFSRYTRPVAGQARTPDEIEKRVVHGFGDNRMHFALVCASSSCPKLRRRAWAGETLERDLDEEARRFVADSTRNELRVGAPTARLSMIFKWYRDDFGGSDDTLRAFVARYVEEATRRHLLEQRPALDYLPYDWTLNAQPNQRPR